MKRSELTAAVRLLKHDIGCGVLQDCPAEDAALLLIDAIEGATASYVYSPSPGPLTGVCTPCLAIALEEDPEDD